MDLFWTASKNMLFDLIIHKTFHGAGEESLVKSRLLSLCVYEEYKGAGADRDPPLRIRKSSHLFNRFQFNRAQTFFNLVAIRFQPCGRFEMFPQAIHGFICCETRCICGDLKQYAAVFTKINGVKITAIENFR